MHNVVFVLFRRMRSPLIALICVNAVAITGFVLIPGVDRQGNPWQMDFLHAFYFVSFMGTTIGFGEIPYPFTAAQRLWATASIYATVTAWLYAIGALLALIQNPAFRALITDSAFRRAVKRMTERFYLICGYGDTGTLLVRALAESGIRSVVIDIAQARINDLELKDLSFHVPGLCADAGKPESLVEAGLEHRYCAGVVALTNEDHVNLQIAITSKLLNPYLPVLARAETHDAEDNIASFGTNHIINPFDTFAGRLALALHSPGMYLLYEWMTSVPHEPLREPLFPPRGAWVLCGYGRFGKAVYEKLTAERIAVTVVEANPQEAGVPAGAIVGRGTEARTLQQANIEHAVGIVAGTDDDANNLSIIMTARDLNSKLFMVARQNQRYNDAIFDTAGLDLVMQRGSIIAHKIFALITTPLLRDFLDHARKNSNDWANELVSRIGGATGDEAPALWTIELNPTAAPAMHDVLAQGVEVRLGILHCDPRSREERLTCVALLIKRDDERILLPEDDIALCAGDQILFCGPHGISVHMDWVVKNYNVLHYVYTGEEHPSSYLWRWLRPTRRIDAVDGDSSV